MANELYGSFYINKMAPSVGSANGDAAVKLFNDLGWNPPDSNQVYTTAVGIYPPVEVAPEDSWGGHAITPLAFEVPIDQWGKPTRAPEVREPEFNLDPKRKIRLED